MRSLSKVKSWGKARTFVYLGVWRGCQTLGGAAGPAAGGAANQVGAGLEAAQTDGDLVVAGTHNQGAGGEDQVSSGQMVFSQHFPS